MKTDKFWMSALWGRIGAALVLIVGTMLNSQGVEVTQEQMEGANSLIDSLISNLHIAAAAVMMVVSKLREQRKTQKSAAGVSGNSGRVVLPVLALIMLMAAAAPWMLANCAQQSATQQLRAQTSDPAVIALGTYADAQDAYIAAAELYKPYQQVVRRDNPDLDAEIVGYLRKADKILTNWETLGDVPVNDKEALRSYLREISIRTALMIEEGGAHGQSR